MLDDHKGKGLGRGLSALLGDDAEDYAALDKVRSTKELPIEFLKANPDQPRRVFVEAEIDELAASIREKGILQPILVRPLDEGTNDYQIVAGERRWRAAQKAQLHNVPVIVKDLTDREVLEIALIENIQRADLNPIDEAAGYRALLQEFDHTQEELSKVIGKSRSHIANVMRLLSLPDDVQKYVIDGHLSAGHARALVNVDAPSGLARELVAKELNVRETEELVRAGKPRRRPSGRKPVAEKDPDTIALEQNLTNTLGLSVEITFDEEKGGDIRISYKTLEQLDDVCQKLSV